MQCTVCDETGVDKFYPTNKSRCKACIIAKRASTVEKTIKTYHCSHCADTDVTNFYASHKSSCKKCTTAAATARYHAFNSQELTDYKNNQRRWQEDNILRYRWTSARARAIRGKLEFTITEQDVNQLWEQQEGLCYYSGLPMERTNRGAGCPATQAVSIDRIDSSLGYIAGNIVLCCSSVNIMKNNLSIDQFKFLIEALHQHL